MRAGREMWDRLGPLELYGYSRWDDLTLSVLTFSPRAKSRQSFTFEPEPVPPRELAGRGMSAAAAPPKGTPK